MTGKIRGLPQAPGVVRIKGSHMTYYSPFYQRWITKSWPKGNGGDTPRRAQARSDFKTATQVIKNAAPEMWAAAEEWARNSPYLARDILMAASMGTFSEITMADGTTKVSLRVTNRTVQQLLDSIGFQPGTLLVRTSDEWQALLPGTANQVLTIDPVTLLPDWATAQGGGGGGTKSVWSHPTGTGWSASTTAFASKGIGLYPLNDTDVTSITCVITAVSGHAYRAGVYAVDDHFTVVAVIAETDVTPATAGAQSVTFPITASLSAGQRYIIAITDVSATGTTVMPAWTSNNTNPYPNFPNIPTDLSDTTINAASFRSATNAPTVGTVYSTPANGAVAIGIIASWTP